MSTSRDELHLRNESIKTATDLLNRFAGYMHSEPNSPQEDQAEAALAEATAQAVKAGMAGPVVTVLLAMLFDSATPEAIQEFLDDAGADLLREAEELNAADQ